jgi:hypothetical protein
MNIPAGGMCPCGPLVVAVIRLRQPADARTEILKWRTDMRTLGLDDNERTLLIELLDARLKELPNEIHHTASHEFRGRLEAEKAALEQLLKRLQAS